MGTLKHTLVSSAKPHTVFRGPSPLFGFLLAIIVPPIGIILSVRSLILVLEKKQKQKITSKSGVVFGVLGIYIGVMLTFIIGFIILGLYSLGGGGHTNIAQVAMKPIQKIIEPTGARQLCVNGDNGYSIDNSQPWYTVYYLVNDASKITQEIKAAAYSSSYSLVSDNGRVQSNQTINIGTGKVEMFNAQNDYLIGSNSKNSSSLYVEVIKKGVIALDCNTGTYGISQLPPTNGAIIYLSILFPNK